MMRTQLGRDFEPSVIDTIFNIAVDYYAAGAVEDAVTILQLLSLVAPHDEGVWLALARVHEDRGQEEVAGALRAVSARIQEVS